MHTANSEPNTPNTQRIENFLFSIDSSITVIYDILHTSHCDLLPPQLPDIGFLLNSTPILMPNILTMTTHALNKMLVSMYIFIGIQVI